MMTSPLSILLQDQKAPELRPFDILPVMANEKRTGGGRRPSTCSPHMLTRMHQADPTAIASVDTAHYSWTCHLIFQEFPAHTTHKKTFIWQEWQDYDKDKECSSLFVQI